MLESIAEDDWILRPRVIESLSVIGEAGIAFEFLTYTRHLPFVLKVLDKIPHLRAVMDHLSKPEIEVRRMPRWQDFMREAALHQNVYCKLSSMVTEADPRTGICSGSALTQTTSSAALRWRTGDVRKRLADLPAGRELRRGIGGGTNPCHEQPRAGRRAGRLQRQTPHAFTACKTDPRQCLRAEGPIISSSDSATRLAKGSSLMLASSSRRQIRGSRFVFRAFK
jgi:amidohydrolase family protein